jgi:hypothetical protein
MKNHIYAIAEAIDSDIANPLSDSDGLRISRFRSETKLEGLNCKRVIVEDGSFIAQWKNSKVFKSCWTIQAS